jgi:4-amino-4-deoxy-L-arabinose transferase-like glycosyltransferase
VVRAIRTWFPLRRGSSLVAAALALYALGLAIFPVTTFLVHDESAYVRQAVAFASGELTVPVLDAARGELVRIPPSTYPIGTSLLQAGFVWLGGWRAAAWASCLALVGFVFLTAELLRAESRQPGFALLVLGFPAALVLGRVSMSDVPNAALCALGFVLFFRGIEGHWSYWLASGFIAGASFLFRDTNAVLFLPLFAGTILRRDSRALALVLGGLAGLALRVSSSLLLYGEPWILRWSPTFSLERVIVSAPYYALVLSTFVPAGLPAALLYRGRRRPEVVATVILVFFFFSAYEYSGAESGRLKQLILGPRYFVPLLPLLILGLADLWARERQRAAPAILRWSVRLARAGTAGILVAAVAVHPLLWGWGRTQQALREDIYSLTSAGSLIVSDNMATEKSINEVYGERLLLSRREVTPRRAIELRGVAPEMFLVFLERDESAFYRAAARDDQAFVDEMAQRCELTQIHDRRYTTTDRLRVWKVGDCPLDRAGAIPGEAVSG